MVAPEERRGVTKPWPSEGGVLQDGLKLCGGQNAACELVPFWSDNFPQLNCAEVQFRVLALQIAGGRI